MFSSHKKFDLSPKLKSGVGRGYSQNRIFKYASFLCLAGAFVLVFHGAKVLFSHKYDLLAAATPKVLGATVSLNSPTPTPLEFISYKVQKGDTIFSISQAYNVDWATLATLNNLQSPFLLRPGQILNIPAN